MDIYKRIALVCTQIPYGRVATYGQIALLCRKPSHARQVGYGLNRKITEDIPAHRVVNHKGCLVGAMAFETADMQQKLLESEGVLVSGEKRVDLEKYGWKNTMEEAKLLAVKFMEEEI